MSDHDIYPNKFNELRSIYKYYIDSYNALYRLNTENEEKLMSIYKKIKTKLIDPENYLPKNIIRDILNISMLRLCYKKSYLFLAKLIYDDYNVEEVSNANITLRFLFYKEYGIKLVKSDDFEQEKIKNFEIQSESTIYRAIMYNDLEKFITITETDGFDKDQILDSQNLLSLLELCCHYGAVDCFKLLRTKFNSEITPTCVRYSFLGGNPEITSECLKYQKPDKYCMKYFTQH
ncbi:hypothetical protein TVAG_166360 [Trichomonas vaginalis G3]|uniref:DUF3447 domain-containing protein n=1 Tax=Trichomonas vaginalis (strain ATCC PRA-98 / G3) TaxID=412133 RepID=A2DE43_TRIV3|nr:protein of unknown function (DUF3447) [Trichomonas vaginalis G3]EAY21261.1 hypothetical protein TVAG_166360 [Trichomonas vaginalis G3]KAI5548835.1 protein of unknown function (DUF3447) [Trichomonas vaginalis G3]|eukprot:XP_001582247.1 hypothetical protein [Trichomonas vaginalis G3]